MKLYIAGPMTGMPNFNDAAFDSAEKLLTALGYEVLSPHHRERPPTDDPKMWSQFFADGIVKLMKCEGIVMLKGWSRSKGASRELELAVVLEKEIFYLQGRTLVPIG